MDSKIKETLTKFYDKVNPQRIDYSCNTDEVINELRRLRDVFSEESSKYQEMIDRKIMEKFDALKYEGKYIRYFQMENTMQYHILNVLKLKEHLMVYDFMVLFLVATKMEITL